MTGELERFCRRVLGDSPAAAEIGLAARRGGGDRITQLAMAARLCRDQPDSPAPAAPPAAEAGGELAGNVAAEMAAATARLPERQREALALREALRLSYEQIGQVMGLEAAAVAPLLARARLRLRIERRGAASAVPGECADAERALRILARRQDSEPLSGEDDEWLHAHLAECQNCEMAHAAMLEASACYRAWPDVAPAVA